jgi:hypothetical protein
VSSLVRWLNLRETEERKWWSCCVPLEGGTWCKYESERIDRAVTHVRGHLDHKPYPCEGKCENQQWYAEEPVLPEFLNVALTIQSAPSVLLRPRIVALIIGDQTVDVVIGGESQYYGTG